LEDYFSLTPSALIERWNDRHILLDVVPESAYGELCHIAEENEEYECHIFKETEPLSSLDEILPVRRQLNN